MAVANLKNDYAYTYVCYDDASHCARKNRPNRAAHVSVNAYLTVILIMYESKGDGIHPLIVPLVQ